MRIMYFSELILQPTQLYQLGDKHVNIVRMVPDPHSHKGHGPSCVINTASLPVSFTYSYSFTQTFFILFLMKVAVDKYVNDIQFAAAQVYLPRILNLNHCEPYFSYSHAISLFQISFFLAQDSASRERLTVIRIASSAITWWYLDTRLKSCM